MRVVPAGADAHVTWIDDIVEDRACAPVMPTVKRPEEAGVSLSVSDSGATGGSTIVVVVVVVVVVPTVVLGPVVVGAAVVAGAAVIEGSIVVVTVRTVVVSRSTCSGDCVDELAVPLSVRYDKT